MCHVYKPVCQSVFQVVTGATAETVMIFTKQALHILTSSKKGNLELMATHQAMKALLYSCFCDALIAACFFALMKELVLVAAALLQELVSPAHSEAGIKLQFLERAKGDDGSSKIDSLLDLLKAQDGANVGTLPKVWPSCSRSRRQAINEICCPTSCLVG